jgi:hypothetical protein
MYNKDNSLTKDINVACINHQVYLELKAITFPANTVTGKAQMPV